MGCTEDIVLIANSVIIIVSVISLIASIGVITLCLIADILDEFTLKIVMYMSINDLIRSCGLIIPLCFESKDKICILFGYIVVYTFISNVVWAASIIVTLYIVIIKKYRNYERFMKYWFIAAYPLLAIIQAIPYATNSYGFDGGMCTLKDDYYGNIWRFTLLYFPYWIFLLLAIWIFYKLHKALKGSDSKTLNSIVLKRGYIYSLIIFVMVIFLSAVRIIQLFANNCAIMYMSFSLDSILGLHGLLNGIALVCNKNVRYQLKYKFCKNLINKSCDTSSFSAGLDSGRDLN
ncbi:hypothetical protein SteCoe_30813 [Stentor coeruleus]|uniref:G-protein coupled receptors family 2 profile 2 domain-containing protein n=1 Tax=Stentor coeruleus TaxID=5963 RepID=A0A1R2B2T7_9CILI|nr:hypothetical protein SteCoe_30813 [Stentor coeruleus]